MANKEVHIGDDWYLGENNHGDLIFYNSRKNEVVKAIDVITGVEDKKGNSINNVLSLNNAEFVSTHSSIQSAFDAAGASGTVVFDPEGGPYEFDSTPTLYDNQTIILHADLKNTNPVDTLSAFFDLSGHTGIEIIPNGHELDGGSRTSGVSKGINSDGTSEDCHIKGTLKVTRCTHRAVSFQGTKLTLDTLIADTIGDKGGNTTAGDALNFGSNSKADRCKANSVIGKDCARHTVAYGSKFPTECEVGTIFSTNPGGAHLSCEDAEGGHVGNLYGTGARNALNYSSPGFSYGGYPALALLHAESGTVNFQIDRAFISGSHGTSADGPDLGYANNCNRNRIGQFISLNAPAEGVIVGTGATVAIDNKIDYAFIQGAGDVGVYARSFKNFCIGSGVIEGCENRGIKSNTLDTLLIIGSVKIKNNCQSSNSAGIAILNHGYLILQGTKLMDDQGTPTQTTGIYGDDLDSKYAGFGVDFTQIGTNYNIAGTNSVFSGCPGEDI